MNNNRFSSIFWDFGGVITSSPFEAFNSFEENNDIPKDFIRKVNSINPNENAWAQLEQSKISLEEFDGLFAKESKKLGREIQGSEVLSLLQGEIRPKIVQAIKKFKSLGFLQACLTNNFDSEDRDVSALDDKNEERKEIMQLFDFIIESKKVGVRKPNNKFYELALSETKVAPEKTIFLDDLGINLKPARKLNISTIKVFSEQQAINELTNLTGIKFD
tara:strand:- start:391 stop:1044 length:654 start_codon:yes stop_codon:yes gene_type:complete